MTDLPEPIKLTVNITPRARKAMVAAADAEKISRTDAVNRALMAWEAIVTAQPGDELRLNLGGRTVRVQLPDGGAA